MNVIWRRVGSFPARAVTLLVVAVAMTVCTAGFAQLHPGNDPSLNLPGTKHDFSSAAPLGPGEYTPPNNTAAGGTALVPAGSPGCLPCHDGPVWNHTPSTFGEDPADPDYIVSETTSFVDVGQPTENATGLVGPESGNCLDCHDGTVALGNFPGTAAASATIDEDGDFGTDLRHHHPVSFTFPEGADKPHNILTRDSGDYHGANAATLFPDPLATTLTVECSTCHDQHTHYQYNNEDNEPYYGSYRWGHFVKANSLCFHCHPRYQQDLTNTSRNAVLGQNNPPPYSTFQVDGVNVKTEYNGHHMPGRTDPFGTDAGMNAADPSDLHSGNKFACIMCHDLGDDTAGDPYGHGHNSACTKCHFRWTPDPVTSPAPTDADSRGHHGGQRWAPLGSGGCDACHADPVTGQLTGAVWGSITTPACGQCHEDVWSGAAIDVDLAVTNAGPTTGYTGETIEFSADVTVPSGLDLISYEWIFGDGSEPELAVNVPWNGPVKATHTYEAAGDYTVYLTVTDGSGSVAPITVAVEIVISDPAADTPDTWTVTPLGGDDFTVVFEKNAGTLLVTKEAGGEMSVGIGIDFGGVVFWMDVWMQTNGAWGIGDSYFGNVSGSSMNGVIFGADGGMTPFSASQP